VPFADEEQPHGLRLQEPGIGWAEEGQRLGGELKRLLGTLAVRIDHIGSTSVPGLPAKDCIDLMVRTEKLDEDRLTDALAEGGYRLRPEPWNHEDVTWGVRYPKLVYAPQAGARSRNVHVRLLGQPNIRCALLFREYLSANPVTRDAWGRFKVRLAETANELNDYGQIKQPATSNQCPHVRGRGMGRENWLATRLASCPPSVPLAGHRFRAA